MKRVLCIPFEPRLAKTRQNMARLKEAAQQIAADKPYEMVVLPELALSGYLLESLVAEAALTVAELEEFAGELTHTGVPARTEWVLGVPLRVGAQVFNAAVVLAGGKVVHIQHKLFLPTYGMFDEGRYFQRGMDFRAYEGNLGKTAILICEDAWHMEMAYAAAETRAEAVVVISSSPARGLGSAGAFDSTLSWRSRLGTFAASYGQNFIYCNRGGTEDGVLFDGTTFAIEGGTGFVAGGESALAGAISYELPDRAGHHTGFAGNSGRQNDLPLFTEILKKLRQ